MPYSKPTPNLQRLAALFGALLLGFVVLFGWLSWRSEKAEQVLQLTTVLELVEKSTDRYFVQMKDDLGELEEDLRSRGGLSDLAAAQQLLRRFHDHHPELTAVNLVALDGQFLATSTTTRLTGLPSTATQRDYPRIVATLRPETPLELSQPLLGPVSQRWILPMRYTVGGAAPAAFFVAAAPVEMLQAFWSDAPVVTKAWIALIRDDGYLISRYPLPPGVVADEVYGKPRNGEVQKSLVAQGYPQRGYIEGHGSLSNSEIGTVFKRLSHFPVTLAVTMPMSEFQAAWWRRVRVPLVLTLLLALGGALGYRTVQRRQQVWDEQRLQAAQRLRDSEALLDRTGRVAAVGGWQFDIGGQRLTWSPQTRRLHEVADDFEPDLAAAIAFYPPEAGERMAAAVETAQRDGTPWDLELPLTTARGRAIWVRAIGEVELGADGRPQRLVGAVQDITEYRQRQLELQREQALRQQAEAHSQQLDDLLKERSEMLDVLAHEVRQPLNNASAALQSAGGVLDEIGERAAASRLARARSVMSQVLSSIDNTLAVAALLARPGPIGREDTDIDTLVAVVGGDIPAGERGRLRIEHLAATRTAPMDMGLVRLALRNLVLNALKYSPAGTPVTVRVADSDEPLALVIDVVDQGPGIAPDLLPRLFERGARGAGSTGHGLGLYIVRRVMELHGGRVQMLPGPEGGLTMRLVFEPGDDYTASSSALNR